MNKKEGSSINPKKILALFGLLLLFVTLCIGLWMISYKIINAVDPGIYIRYATDGKYDKDVFLNEEINLKTGIIDDLVNGLRLDDNNKNNPINRQTFATRLLENKELLISAIQNNKKYGEYLDEQKLKTSDVISYLEKISSLDQTLLNGSFYLCALLCILIFYLLQHRIIIYVLAVITYVFSVLNIFTSNIVADLFYYPFRYISLISSHKSELEFEDYMVFVNNFLPAIKEAFLSYIIVDTIGQHFKEKRNKEMNQSIINLYYFLPTIINELKIIGESNNSLKITRFNTISLENLQKFCRKNKSDIELMELLKFLKNKQIKSLNVREAVELLTQIKGRIYRSKSIKRILEGK